MTARPVLYRHQTEEWLLRNGVNYSILMMRGNEDTRHSQELKYYQLLSLAEKHGIEAHHIVAAYDDREDVIDMYTNFGIRNAEVRAIHNTCAYTQKEKA